MNRQRSVQVIAMRFGDKDPMTFGPLFLLFALGVVFALICVWIGPDLAVVLGIGTVGTLLVVVRSFRPSSFNAFWAGCIDIGQNSRFR